MSGWPGKYQCFSNVHFWVFSRASELVGFSPKAYICKDLHDKNVVFWRFATKRGRGREIETGRERGKWAVIIIITIIVIIVVITDDPDHVFRVFPGDGWRWGGGGGRDREAHTCAQHCQVIIIVTIVFINWLDHHPYNWNRNDHHLCHHVPIQRLWPSSLLSQPCLPDLQRKKITSLIRTRRTNHASCSGPAGGQIRG